MKCAFATALVSGVALSAVAALQAQTESPAPPPELRKLDFLVGDWKAEGTVDLTAYKLGPDQPGGRFTYSFHNEWLPGRFFLVGRENYDIPGQGKSAVLTVYSYDLHKKLYNHVLYRGNVGETEITQFTMDRDTWRLSSQDQIEGKPVKGRFTMKVLSPNAYTMKYEVSPDGKTWSTVLEGKAIKQ